MTSSTDETQHVELSDLTTTWRTLMEVSRNYEAGGLGEHCLIEARRLIEVEVRQQHGDAAWQTMMGWSDD